MENEKAIRRGRLMEVADCLVDKVALAVEQAQSAGELKQLTGALRELKEIQELREQGPEAALRVVLEDGVGELAG